VTNNCVSVERVVLLARTSSGIGFPRGGKGALIGGVAGAAAGAGGEVLTRGHSVRVPRDTLLTFRLERPLELAVGRAHRGFRN